MARKFTTRPFGRRRARLGGFPGAAGLTTSLAGADNDVTYTSKARGAWTNQISIRYVVAGNNTALSVSVSGLAITVNVATDGAGAATSTATNVRTALTGNAAASALINHSLAQAAGTGVVTALSATKLAGGRDYTIGY